MQENKFLSEMRQIKSEFTSLADDLEKVLHPTFHKPYSWDFEGNDQANSLESGSLKKDFFDMVKEKLNSFIHRSRLSRYQELRSDSSKRRYIAEGDSWFQLPMVDDVVDYLLDDGYAVCCFSAAGDTLADMALDGEFLHAVEFERPRLFLLSGGGNDLLEPRSLRALLDPASPHQVNQNALDSKLGLLAQSIESILFLLQDKNPDLPLLMHGYDYIIPRKDPVFSWVYPVMLEKGIQESATQAESVAYILDAYNTLLSSLESKFPGKFYYLDLRGSVLPGGWYDEIHPNEQSFKIITEKFKTKIAALLD